MTGMCILHVLPAVELADATDLRVNHRFGGVTSTYQVIISNIIVSSYKKSSRTVTKDKSLNMCSTDLAAMVKNITSGRNQNLSSVKRVQIDLRVSKRNKYLVLLCSCTDTVHLRAVAWKTVLTVLLQQRQGLLVVDAPHPVRVARNPCVIIWLGNEEIG